MAFAPDGHHGDWNEVNVNFTIAGQLPAGGQPQVIVTGNSVRVQPQNTPAVVALTMNLELKFNPPPLNVTNISFTLLARNSDLAAGEANFHWIFVLETGKKQDLFPVPNLRFGVVQPKHFSSTGSGGDTQTWPAVTYSDRAPPFPATAAGTPQLSRVVLTANDLSPAHNVPAVGLVYDPTPQGFMLKGRNSDCAEGYCNFFYLAACEGGNKKDILIDSGQLNFTYFKAGKTDGDWHFWDKITFKRSFKTPPVVLVTGSDVDLADRPVAVVGIARTVTPNGFTLAARNSDNSAGWAGFRWIALGCDEGCG